MKIKVIRRFIDRANSMITRETGEVYEAPDKRADFLIRLGLAVKAAEQGSGTRKNEAVEAPQSGGEAEGEEVPAELKKTAKRGKKTAK